jgi:hypothetical protein
MRWTALLVAAMAVGFAGCRLARSAVHNLWNEPIEYLDERRTTKLLQEEAEELLAEMRNTKKRHCTDDFAEGFIDGYADYLERGGNTAPPAVPPLKYRRGRFLNPDGHARVHDYFAGFQAGAETAAGTGKRQYMTVPVLVPDPVPVPPVNARQTPADQCAPPPPKPADGPAESLPNPRPEPTTGLPAPDRPPADPIRPGLPAIPAVDPLKVDPMKLGLPPADPPKADPAVPRPPLPKESDPPAAKDPGRSDRGPTDPNGLTPTAIADRVLIQGETPYTRSVVPPLRDPTR